MSRVFTNGLGDLGSIPGRVIPKTQKTGSWCRTRHYKVRIKGKVEQSWEWSSTLGVVAIEKGTFGSPSTKVTNFILFFEKKLCFMDYLYFGKYSFSVYDF